jgi:ERCC4-type nuclease
MIIVDNREKKLLPHLDAITKNLDIGDIHFVNNNNLILLIERKTVDDLAASIKDKRSREQKLRLQQSDIPNEKIMYLIEGNLNKKYINGMPTESLWGFIVNTIVRDNIKVYHTNSINETITLLKKIDSKIENITPEKNLSQEAEYADVVKKVKKEQMDYKTCFICQLSQIPGVSSCMADIIVEKYKNMVNLINIYNSIDDINDKRKLLKDLTYPIVNNKKRRIGIKVSERIYDFLTG